MSCCNCSPAPAPVAPSAVDAATASTFRWMATGLFILVGGLAMYLSLAINISPPTGLSRTILHTALATTSGIGLIFAGAPIFKNSLVPRITLEQMFLIGLIGSFGASLYCSITGVGHIYYEVVIILLAIYHLGQLITRAQTKRLESLENEIPGLRSTARIAGENTEIPVTKVQTGQLLEVRLGEVIPADGIVVDGSAFVEKLVHTGEPFPTPIAKGETLLAGCRVLDGTLILRATSPGSDRELDRLLAVCEETSSLPTESIAITVLRFFVPAVVTISVLTFIIWTALGDPSRALFNALAVAIVACPCGIGIAVPLAIRRSHARLRLLGLVPHVPDFLERLAMTDLIAFDKTGTLTSPTLSIGSIDTEPDSPAELLSWISAIQRQSSHPVARPFWNIAEPASLDSVEITTLPARGITATFTAEGKKHELTICNSLHLAELHPDQAQPDSTDRTLHLILDGKITGHVIFQENSRESALASLETLKNEGYKVELLTGDSGVPAVLQESVPCFTGLTPTQKADLIRKHQQAGHTTLLVGDGLNDTEGMSAAHTSIALGPEAKAASAVASATLSHHDLAVIPQAITLAKGARKNLNQLLAFTLVYNFTGITLAATGILHPVHAAILMLASSATVLSMAGRTPKLKKAKA